MPYFITATAQDDHIRVEVHRVCIVEWSDDQINWQTFAADQRALENGVPVLRDYTAKLNVRRSYRARPIGEELVTATRREPGYREPTLEEIRARLAVAMAGRTADEEMR